MTDAIHAPIMIVGVRPRCGTNYLCDLINLHPDVARPNPIDEDYFLEHAGHLEKFAQGVGRHWSNLSRPVPPAAQEDVLRALGVGLLGWLTALAGGKRVVTKTPLADRLDMCFRLFPSAKLLLLVRDGRAVIESHMRSWPHDGRFGDDLFKGLCEAWTLSAERMMTFRRNHPVTDYPYMLVRYEDLVHDPEDRLQTLFAFLDLDDASVDLNAVHGLPVRGSSTFGRAPGDPLTWQGAKKDRTFDPLDRWAHWSAGQHGVFNDIAGPMMEELGYALKQA